MIEDITKKSFIFIIQLEVLAYTTARILTILMERSIEVDELHFYGGDSNCGRLMIHCQMLHDRIGRTATDEQAARRNKNGLDGKQTPGSYLKVTFIDKTLTKTQ